MLMKKIIKEYSKQIGTWEPTFWIQEIDIEYSGSSIWKVKRCELELAEDPTMILSDHNDIPVINGSVHMMMLS